MSLYGHFQSICYHLFTPQKSDDAAFVFDPADQLNGASEEPAEVARQLNAAFLILLAGSRHPAFTQAQGRLRQLAQSSDCSAVARFYLAAKDRISHEIETVGKHDQDFTDRLKHLANFLENSYRRQNVSEVTENIWAVFFPEGAGLSSTLAKSIHAIREKRAVEIIQPNPDPIRDPAEEILFTSNVLLTLPAASQPIETLSYHQKIKQKLFKAASEPQLYWYDHPIHIGVKPQNNELLYGLRGLQEALTFERERGSTAKDSNMTCIISVSVTHQGLHAIARPYIEKELSRAGLSKRMDVFVFTEDDAQRIIHDILIPSARHFLGHSLATNALAMLGVDGEYGRHFSFLKAIVAFWHVFIQPKIKATFKIDLDQVFPQQNLVAQTGASAFEHFTTPLWGARGTDSRGRPVELGMIAGALVNESDIGKSLYTPDVRLPERPLAPDEHIFFSVLPQAVSTEAEMMTRYNSDRFDGVRTCIQRVHVTGGTSGIRIESLRRHRSFTPSFIGRAEDQAYLLSALKGSGESLAYLHKDGLIMRHDKEAFAQEAIETAEIGRMVGDYVRMLYFSAYARVLGESLERIKDTLDPFTGCFISNIPTTVALLRFALKAAALFRDNQKNKGSELVITGAQRISKALEFVRRENSGLAKQYEKERRGWNLYYDTLDATEKALRNKDTLALDLQQKARSIIRECKVAAQGRGQSA